MDHAGADDSHRATLPCRQADSSRNVHNCATAGVQLRREVSGVADRRAGKVPHVREQGSGKQPRSRTKSGRWREKCSDAGKKRK
jgi:hypothetical protein